jgi:hypothetical protein
VLPAKRLARELSRLLDQPIAEAAPPLDSRLGFRRTLLINPIDGPESKAQRVALLRSG